MDAKNLTQEDLLALGTLFADSLDVKDPDSFEQLPDGEYLCQVVEVVIKKTAEKPATDTEPAKPSKLMGVFRFRIMDGEEGAGRNIFKNTVFSNAKNMKRFTNDLEKFGIVADSPEEMLLLLDQAVDIPCLVTLKTDSQGRQWQSVDVPEE